MCLNLAELVNCSLHMSRDFLEVKVSDGSVCTGHAPAGSGLPFPRDDSSGMPEAARALLLTRCCSEEHLFSSSCWIQAGWEEGAGWCAAEQVRGDGCGKPGTAGSPGRREQGGLQRCWGQLVEGGKRTASESIWSWANWLGCKTDNSRERGEFWNYKRQNEREGKQTAGWDAHPAVCVEQAIVKCDTAG